MWVAALVFTALVSRTIVYAGLVQPLGLDPQPAHAVDPDADPGSSD